MDGEMLGFIDYANLYNRGRGVEGEIHVRADHGFGGRTIRLDPDDFGRFLVDLDAAGRRPADFLGVAVRCLPGSQEPLRPERIEVLG